MGSSWWWSLAASTLSSRGRAISRERTEVRATAVVILLPPAPPTTSLASSPDPALSVMMEGHIEDSGLLPGDAKL